MPGNSIKWKIIGPPDRIDYKHKHPFDEEKDIFPLIIETESALKEKKLKSKNGRSSVQQHDSTIPRRTIN